MAENSAIEWTDSTFNPWIGCTRVSPGCDNCYAAAQDKFRKWTPEGWGGPRRRTSEANWRKPLRQWNEQQFAECGGCGWRGEAREAMAKDYHGESAHVCPRCESATLHKARRRVFCASLADVFDNQVDPQWRQDLIELILETPNLDWLLLTKRIGNVSAMLDAITLPGFAGLPDHAWLGATIVNPEEADRDIPKLLATRARVRFLSMEPLLGPVDVRWTFADAGVIRCPRCRFSTNRLTHGPCPNDGATLVNDVGIDWVIVGGESGPGARPMHPDWARSLRDQCAAAGVPFLFKQWGEWAPGSNFPDRIPSGTYCDFDGDLKHDDERVWKVGKKAAGRLLDGVTHDGFPNEPASSKQK